MNNKWKVIRVAFNAVAITAVLAATYIGIRYVMIDVLKMSSTFPLTITYIIVVPIAIYAYSKSAERYIRGTEVDLEKDIGWLNPEKLSSPLGVKSIFWFIGIVVIPVLGYIYSYPMAVILTVFKIHCAEKAAVIICLAGGVLTYYAMWKYFKNSRMLK